MDVEKLAYWFFRLNGCFTFENFIVHPDQCGSQRTDADLIAVRFQHRSELQTSGRPMKDHDLFSERPGLINAYFVEAKAGQCQLNGPWTNPKKQDLQRVLFAMGFLSHDRVEVAATELYERLQYDDDLISIRMVAVGREETPQEPTTRAVQLTWSEVLAWIHGRFNDYAGEKRHHPQWDGSARRLFRTATKKHANDADAFIAEWLQHIRVSPGSGGDGR